MAKTAAEKEAELRQAGWSPSAGDTVEGAWARTATAEDRAADAGLPAPGPATPAPGPGPAPAPTNPQQNIDLAKIQAGFAASAGLSIKQLEEQKRQFDLTIEWQKKMWEQQGLPQLAIQQRAQDLEEKKFSEMSGLATRQQGWVEEIGRRQATLAEKSQADANAIAQGQLGLGQQQLGLDTLKTAASLGGPADWIKAANFTRGAANSALPAFIRQLLTGGNTAVLGGPQAGMQQSAPQTLEGLADRMGAGGAMPGVSVGGPAASAGFGGSYSRQGQPGGTPVVPGGDQLIEMNQQPDGVFRYMADKAQQQNNATDQAAGELRRVYGAGGAALGPQQLEGLTPSEMAMFQGGGESVGADVPGFVTQYKRSRIGQGASQLGGY